MKAFLTKKRTIFITFLFLLLVAMIALLIVPLGSWKDKVLIFDFNAFRFSYVVMHSGTILDCLTSPFSSYDCLLVTQTLVFSLILAAFIILLTLLIKDILKQYPYKRQRKLSKEARLKNQIVDLQQQIDDLQKQIDDLTSTK